MRITLSVEGCYPFSTGGVSTWCDQLIRGLPDHTFDVVAVTANSRLRPAMALPSNVGELRPLPLWDWSSPRTMPPRPVREAFGFAYRALLEAMLMPAAAPTVYDAGPVTGRAGMLPPATEAAFEDALRGLFDFAQEHDLAAAFRGEDAVEALLAVWPLAYPDVTISLHDAVHATELLSHLLLPLGAPVPRADVSHPVSNGLPALVALTARWRYGTPILLSEHGVYLRERYLAFQSVQYRWPVKAVMLAFLRRLCRLAYEASSVIAPVNVYNRRWETRLGADPDRIRTVYNGVDADALPPAPGEPAVPTVVWVGRVDPLKDLDTLVRAFALVRERVPDAVLRLFGPTPAGNHWYEAQLRALVHQLGLEHCITFEGVARPVTDAYHAATVVALSSVSEGLPYTVMEAMMCGRTTVSTDVGGVAEVVGMTGRVVPPQDLSALAGALTALLLDHTQRRELALAARERALDLFQLRTMLGTFSSMYSQLGGDLVIDLDQAGAAPRPRGLARPWSRRMARANR